MRREDEVLDTAGVKPTSLGVPEHKQGMDDDPAKLRTADPFDEAFLGMMIPHHEGAIEIARTNPAGRSATRSTPADGLAAGRRPRDGGPRPRSAHRTAGDAGARVAGLERHGIGIGVVAVLGDVRCVVGRGVHHRRAAVRVA